MDKATKIIRYQNWADIFRGCSVSGLRKTQFCRERGIPVKSLRTLPLMPSTKVLTEYRERLTGSVKRALPMPPSRENT